MRAFLLMLALAATIGCGSEPTVEALDADDASPTAFTLTRATGDRDGARTRARFVFADPTRGELVLDLLLGYDPQPELVSGSWTLAGIEGSVHAEAVRFVGGQGEGPSVGGVYRLDDGDGSRFRVRLPLTRVGGGWSP